MLPPKQSTTTTHHVRAVVSFPDCWRTRFSSSSSMREGLPPHPSLLPYPPAAAAAQASAQLTQSENQQCPRCCDNSVIASIDFST